MGLPIQKTPDKDLTIIQTRWSALLNPILANLLVEGSLLTDIPLVNGVNTFNHYLGKQMNGWIIVDQNAAVSIYRSQPFNNENLTLTSSGAVTISLWVF